MSRDRDLPTQGGESRGQRNIGNQSISTGNGMTGRSRGVQKSSRVQRRTQQRQGISAMETRVRSSDRRQRGPWRLKKKDIILWNRMPLEKSKRQGNGTEFWFMQGTEQHDRVTQGWQQGKTLLMAYFYDDQDKPPN